MPRCLPIKREYERLNQEQQGSLSFQKNEKGRYFSRTFFQVRIKSKHLCFTIKKTYQISQTLSLREVQCFYCFQWLFTSLLYNGITYICYVTVKRARNSNPIENHEQGLPTLLKIIFSFHNGASIYRSIIEAV